MTAAAAKTTLIHKYLLPICISHHVVQNDPKGLGGAVKTVSLLGVFQHLNRILMQLHLHGSLFPHRHRVLPLIKVFYPLMVALL